MLLSLVHEQMCHTMPTNQQSTSIWMIITYRKAQDGFKPNRPGAPPCQNWINKTRGLPPYSRRRMSLTSVQRPYNAIALISNGCKPPHKHLGVKQLPEGWSLDELVYPLPQATPLSVRHPLGRFGSRPVDRLAFEPASVGTPRQRNAPNPR